MAEGAPLLREYAVKSCIEGSNPSLSAISIEKLNYINELWQKAVGAVFCSPAVERSAGV